MRLTNNSPSTALWQAGAKLLSEMELNSFIFRPYFLTPDSCSEKITNNFQCANNITNRPVMALLFINTLHLYCHYNSHFIALQKP